MAVSSPAIPHTSKFMPATIELLHEGRYRLDNTLSQNGDGTSFIAFDTIDNRNVVIKEIPIRLNKITTLSQQQDSRSSFASMSERLGALRHDCIINVVTFFTEIGRNYLVLEYAEGDDFNTLLKQNNRPFPYSDVIRWADQLLEAIYYLHSQDPPLIHRVIRPRHIKLTPDGGVKLFGHGLSDVAGTSVTTQIAENSKEISDLNYSPLEIIWEGLDAASQKVIVNSYDDRSERILKQPPDARSDIYSLAATLYYLLTAKVPVDPLERSIELLEGRPDPLVSPNTLEAQVPAELSDLIMRAMEIKRENRFDSALIMRQVLKTAVVRLGERDAVSDTATSVIEETFVESTPAALTKEEPVHSALEEYKIKQAEILEKKLREAEEQRIAAEKRAAEAERLLRQHSALETEPERSAEPQVFNTTSFTLEDDLLGLSISDAPNPVGIPVSEELHHPDTGQRSEKAAEDSRPSSKTDSIGNVPEPEEPQPVLEESSETSFNTPEPETIRSQEASLVIDESPAQPVVIVEAESVVPDATEVVIEAEPVEFLWKRSDTGSASAERDMFAASLENEVKSEIREETPSLDEPQSVEQRSEKVTPETPRATPVEMKMEQVTATTVRTAEVHRDERSLFDNEPGFLEDELPRVGSSLPIPMIAGAAALLLVIAIVGWFLLGSSGTDARSSASPAANSNAVQTPASTYSEQPVALPTQQEAAINESPAPADEPVASSPAEHPTARSVTKPVQSAKAEKPAAAPAKTPEPKKKVTVDDLINDN